MWEYLKFIIIVISVLEGCRSQVNKDTVTSSSTVATSEPNTSSLSIPYPKYMIITDPATVTVRWDPVTVSEDNPILGFKIKLWEDEKKIVFTHVEKDGEQVLVQELVPIKKSFHVLPTHEPAFVAVVPPDVFTATFDVKIGEHYELRGQTFNADGDGPLSNSYGFRIHSAEETKKLEEKKSEKSE